MIRALLLVWALMMPAMTVAQSDPLTIATITRPPFSMVENGQDAGFSIDLWRAVAEDLGLDYQFTRVDVFGDMLAAVQTGQADGAIANISITAAREEVMDFTQPIYLSGLQIMVPEEQRGMTVWSILARWDVFLAIVAAFAGLWLAGMVMYALERRHQDYFDETPSKASFPAFWWALNLIVNGGFEQVAPRTFLGRILGTLMVISSLFIVSIFVAKITATLTVDAIQNNVQGINDLYDKRVATIAGSTSANFLENRDLRFVAYDGLGPLFDAYERGEVDAVVFDAPILAYYVTQNPPIPSALIGRAFLPENYGMALPSGSALAEPINQSLLRLRESGEYASLLRKWFGSDGT